MLQPNSFDVNETWVFFQLSNVPIRTQHDGDFDVYALMDAASGFILSMVFVKVRAPDMPLRDVKKILNDARAHKEALPVRLLMPVELTMTTFQEEAQRRGIKLQRVPSAALAELIEDAQEGYAEQFGDGAAG